MARMIPDQVSDHVRSQAERKMFDRIRQGLSEWTALHSLGLAYHHTKPWAELDFVLIGPPGVICVEVKGGRIARENGIWTYIDRDGQLHSKREGPFEQAGSASSALHAWLKTNVRGLGSHFVAYCVATPDTHWRVKGPDIVPQLIYDADDSEIPVDHFISRVVDYWRGLTVERIGLQARPLDQSAISRIISALRGDFDLRPSIRARVRNINDELLSLTRDQYRVLDGLTENRKVLVRGGAGTGKTMLAIEEAERAINSGRRVAVICYSRRLGASLREILGKSCYFVGHLHGLMSDVVRRSGRTGELPDADTGYLMQVAYPELTLEGLADLGEMGKVDLLIVDETQDLVQDLYLDVFDGLLDGGLARGSWRFFLDPIQNIFDVMHAPALERVMKQPYGQLQKYPSDSRTYVSHGGCPPRTSAAG
jgi:hypothetical protein